MRLIHLNIGCHQHQLYLVIVVGQYIDGQRHENSTNILVYLHEFLFNEPFAEAHNATADVEATTRCFLELIRKEMFTSEELDVSLGYFRNFSEANPHDTAI